MVLERSTYTLDCQDFNTSDDQQESNRLSITTADLYDDSEEAFSSPLSRNQVPSIQQSLSNARSVNQHLEQYSNNLTSSKPIEESDFLFPTKKKLQILQSKESRDCNKPLLFKTTPSGNLKINSKQVIYSSDKLCVVVADPKTTRVINCTDNLAMTQTPRYSSAAERKLSQMNFKFSSQVENDSVRITKKEDSDYKKKQTNEILNPEVNLIRLGFSGNETIQWDSVVLPEKTNLYLKLYSRITNHTNADCKVYVDNEEFNCHLLVLQCYSELFDSYNAIKKIEIPGDKCSTKSFSFIYDWMINGEPSYQNLTRDNVLDIFKAAKYLKIKDLIEQCWAFIDNMKVFNEDTAFILYMDAKRKNLSEVKELMLPRVQDFFLMLVSSQDWLDLEVEDVKLFLNSNYISVNTELEIFMAAVRWLKYDWTTRDQAKYEVLECVRFGNICSWQLVDIKRNPENPDFMELAKDARICKMIDDGMAYMTIKDWYGSQNDDFQQWNNVLGLQEPAERNWTGCKKTYFTYREFLIFLDQYRRHHFIDRKKTKTPVNEVINKMTESPAISTINEFLTKKKSTSQELSPKQINQEAYKIFKTSFQKYCDNTCSDTKKEPLLFGRNAYLQLLQMPKKQIKSTFNSQFSDVSSYCLFERDFETILVIGGMDPHCTYGVGRNTSKSIFKYLANVNKWEFVCDLPEPRYQQSACFATSRIYVVGGCDPREDEAIAKSEAWSLDPITRLWYKEPHLIEGRKSFGLVFIPINNTTFCLYAIGGKGVDSSCLKSVEKYESQHPDKWTKSAPMLCARMGASCAKYRNCIWVTGGLSGPKNKTVLASVESYNPQTDQWTTVRGLPFPRAFSSMIFLQNRLYLIGGISPIEGGDSCNHSVTDVEVWNPATSCWENLMQMSLARHCLALGHLGTQIFISGGVSTEYRRALSNIECLCCERGLFVRGVAHLPMALSGHSVVTLPKLPNS